MQSTMESIKNMESLNMNQELQYAIDGVYKGDPTNSTLEEDRVQQRQEQGSMETVSTWANSLDRLLADPSGVQNFFSFLKQEHSTENLQFWLSVQDFKASPESLYAVKSRSIYMEYLSPTASSQINIDNNLLRKVQTSMSKPYREMFRDMEEEIYRLMRGDSYPRFLKSKRYTILLENVTEYKTKMARQQLFQVKSNSSE